MRTLRPLGPGANCPSCPLLGGPEKKSGHSKVMSAAENHEENQSLFADAVSTKESTIREPVENKLMKVSKENSWYLDPSHFSSWLQLTTVKLRKKKEFKEN